MNHAPLFQRYWPLFSMSISHSSAKSVTTSPLNVSRASDDARKKRPKNAVQNVAKSASKFRSLIISWRRSLAGTPRMGECQNAAYIALVISEMFSISECSSISDVNVKLNGHVHC